MEIGNEISQKIRSAIKAKLVDLGVYVDDELPDYIMVMVANKKSQDQMTEDLNLFLGNNTEKFTSWLHALLLKLQSITADPIIPNDDYPTETELMDGQSAEGVKLEIEEDELLIGPEHDDFEEEANRENDSSARIAQAKILPISQPHATYQQQDISTVVSTARGIPQQSLVWSSRSMVSVGKSSTTSSRESSFRRRDHSPRSDVRSRLGCSGINRSSEKTSELTLQKQRAAMRKRRAPESVIGSVVRHDIEEEQYDPRRPLIGRVASTVRVGERRPTVPPGQQANKNLLLKAMTEAANSINKATQRLTEQVALEEEVKQDISVEDRHGMDQGKERERRYGRRGNRPRVETRGIMRSAGSTQRITRVAPHPNPEVNRHDDGGVDRSVQLYSRSKREEVLQQFRAGLNSDSEETIEPAVEHQPRENIAVDNRQVEMSTSTNASRPEENEESEQRTITIGNPAEKPVYSEEPIEETMDTLIESGADESDFTDDENTARIVEEAPPEAPKERPESPKFVVTLDGVDPTTMIHSGSESTGMDAEMEVDDVPKQATVVRVAPQCISSSTPLSMSATSLELNDSDYFLDYEPNGTPPKQSRGLERCKFWLACRNGNQCPFHHPSAPCKLFPKCKFGDKCLYIHPNCRFDANCTRPNCPFTHATKRPGQPAAQGTLPLVIHPLTVMPAPANFHTSLGSTSNLAVAAQNPVSQTTCRFFPKCTNMNCKYLHPKLCRYGVSCRDKNICSFTHPELPPASKLKWTAPSINRALSDSASVR